MKSIILDSIPILISLLAAITFYKRLQPYWLRFLFYFLLITFVVDIGAVLYSGYLKKSNHFIANIFFPISFTFYFLLFYKTIEVKKFKKAALASFAIYLVVVFYDIFFINGLYLFNSYAYSVGSFLIVLCCLLYFMWLFTPDKLINYFRIPMFWIATGLLFYYAGNLVQMSLLHYIIENKLDPGGSIYHFIVVTLNVLLYGSFTIAFLCNQVWKKAR